MTRATGGALTRMKREAMGPRKTQVEPESVDMSALPFVRPRYTARLGGSNHPDEPWFAVRSIRKKENR